MPPNNALIVKAENGSAHDATNHISGPVVVVAIMAAMLGECDDQSKALGTSGTSAALGVIGGARGDITHHDNWEITNINSQFERWCANQNIDLAFTELLFVLFTSFPVELPTMF